MKDNKSDKNSLLKYAGEVLEVSAKTALSVIPVGGALITSVWDSVKSNCAQKRLIEWQDLLEERLSKIEATLDDVGNDEKFTTAIYHATEMAIKTAEHDKRIYLANATTNAFASVIDESIMMMFLDMIDKYTVLHIKILMYFQAPSKYIDLNNNTISMGSPKEFLYKVYPEFKSNDALVDKIIKDLYRDGLMGTESLNVSMTVNGMIAPRTTELGNRFIHFITENKEGE